jgi:hypothetical protein
MKFDAKRRTGERVCKCLTEIDPALKAFGRHIARSVGSSSWSRV